MRYVPAAKWLYLAAFMLLGPSLLAAIFDGAVAVIVVVTVVTALLIWSLPVGRGVHRGMVAIMLALVFVVAAAPVQAQGGGGEEAAVDSNPNWWDRNKGNLGKWGIGALAGGVIAVGCATGIGCGPAFAAVGAYYGIGTAVDVGSACLSGDCQNSQLVGGMAQIRNADGVGDVLAGMGSVMATGAPSCGHAADQWQGGQNVKGLDQAFCGVDVLGFGIAGKVAAGSVKLGTSSSRVLKATGGADVTDDGIKALLASAKSSGDLKAAGVATYGTLKTPARLKVLKDIGYVDDVGKATPQGYKVLATGAGKKGWGGAKALEDAHLLKFKKPPANFGIAASNIKPNAVAAVKGVPRTAYKGLKSAHKAPKAVWGSMWGHKARTAYHGGRTLYLGSAYTDAGPNVYVPGGSGDPEEDRGERDALLVAWEQECASPRGEYPYSVGGIVVSEAMAVACGSPYWGAYMEYLECVSTSTWDVPPGGNIMDAPECQGLSVPLGALGIECIDVYEHCIIRVHPMGAEAYRICTERFGFDAETCKAVTAEGDFLVNLLDLFGGNHRPVINDAGTHPGDWYGVNKRVYRHQVLVADDAGPGCSSNFLLPLQRALGHCGFDYYTQEVDVAVWVNDVVQTEETMNRDDLALVGAMDGEVIHLSIPALIDDTMEKAAVATAVTVHYYLQGTALDGSHTVFPQLYQADYSKTYSTTAEEGGSADASGDTAITGYSPDGDECKRAGGSGCVSGSSPGLPFNLAGVLKYWWVFVLLLGGVIAWKKGWVHDLMGKKKDDPDKELYEKRPFWKVFSKKPRRRLKKEYRDGGVPLRVPARDDGTGPDYDALRDRLEEDP